MRSGLVVTLMAAAAGTAGCLGIDELPPDELAPQVQVASPLANSTVGGGVSIDINAIDDYSVEVVRILIDGSLKATFYTRPYHFVWSTIGIPNNSVHTIAAEAVDPSNNIGRAQISVTVLNGVDAPPR
jgi:hypothetical protein